MAKSKFTKKAAAKRNPYAKDLANAKYGSRKVPFAKLYIRKEKHRKGMSDVCS